MERREQDLKELKKDVMLVPEEESIRVQSVIKMKDSIVKQRQAEEALFEQMLAEQKMVDELNESLDENLMRTIELRKYNREIKEHMQNQVYRMNGLSPDKLEGMAHYKKAFYIGSAFAIFILSCVMVVLTGLAHGFTEDICLFLSYFTALEGTVLITEARPNKLVRAIFRVIYYLLFPAMMVIFICYELGYPEYERFLPYFCLAGLVIFVAAMISYFTYNPYNSDKQYIRKAKAQLKNIKKAAQKEVRKNQRAAQKEAQRAKYELQNEAEAAHSDRAAIVKDTEHREADMDVTDIGHQNDRENTKTESPIEKTASAPEVKAKTTRVIKLSKKEQYPEETEPEEHKANEVEKMEPEEHKADELEKIEPEEHKADELEKIEEQETNVEISEKRGQRGIVQCFRRDKA